VPAAAFIKEFAEHLKRTGKVSIPEWAEYAKTSCAKELTPLDADWMFHRMAALVRKVYLYPQIGVGTLSRMLGGAKDRGHNKLRFQRASRKVIRYALIELEKLGLVNVNESHDERGAMVAGGRLLSREGRRDCDRIAREVGLKLAEAATPEDEEDHEEEEDDEDEEAAAAGAAEDDEE
jgi:small subunit ribosomal protein S19e